MVFGHEIQVASDQATSEVFEADLEVMEVGPLTHLGFLG